MQGFLILLHIRNFEARQNIVTAHAPHTQTVLILPSVL